MAQAVTARELDRVDSEALLAFLAQRRWFGAKGRRPRSARIIDALPVPWSDADVLARVDVELPGETLRYQLPLAIREAEMSRLHAPRAVLARVDCDGMAGLLFDATEDAAFLTGLGRFALEGGVLQGRATRLVAERVAREVEPSPPGVPIVSAAEQSNTSIIYGERAMLKLFRQLRTGEQPDVEIARFLATRTDFRGTPALLAAMRYEDRDGAPSTAAMVSRYLPGSVDGWTHALVFLRAHLRASGGEETFDPEAHQLGASTRALHDALASDRDDPAFAPEPVTDVDVAQWRDAARHSIEQALDLLAERAASLDARTQPMARAIAGRRAAVLARLDEVVQAIGAPPQAGRKTRIHGDYHLGQVLRTRDGAWMIIDFEGEPARSLAERRAKSSPWRDVAGMLRSFAYAAATAAAEAGGAGAGVDAAIEVRSARWERDARAAFRAGYGDAPGEQLIALFEMEKMFYELAYELNNRPAWVWIPLRGIAKLF